MSGGERFLLLPSTFEDYRCAPAPLLECRHTHKAVSPHLHFWLIFAYKTPIMHTRRILTRALRWPCSWLCVACSKACKGRVNNCIGLVLSIMDNIRSLLIRYLHCLPWMEPCLRTNYVFKCDATVFRKHSTQLNGLQCCPVPNHISNTLATYNYFGGGMLYLLFEH